MESPRITVNGLVIVPRTWTAHTFPGKLSGKDLAGIDMELRTGRQSEIDAIEQLPKENAVEVVDPFVQRTYEAKFHIRQSSYRDDNPTRYYQVEIREIDAAPVVTEIELDGDVVPVLKYRVYLYEDSLIHQALLQLTPDQFQRFQAAVKQRGTVPVIQTVQIKRLGVDDGSVTYRYGGGMYWSKHEADEGTYYKQILTFLPQEAPIARPMLLDAQILALTNVVRSAYARLEAVVTELGKANILNAEQQATIMQSDWKQLTSESLRSELDQELRKSNDAEEVFD